jgi:hypothetical protein
MIGRNLGEPALEYHALTSLVFALLVAGKMSSPRTAVAGG